MYEEKLDGEDYECENVKVGLLRLKRSTDPGRVSHCDGLYRDGLCGQKHYLMKIAWAAMNLEGGRRMEQNVM